MRSLFVSPTPGGFADGAYAIAPSQGYEPYFLILRSRVPWYDERFRGYGRDKIVHVAHVIAEGTRFFALPEGFAVHVPHPRTVTFKATKDLGQWDKLKTLYMNVLKELKRGTFVPMTTLRQGLCTNDAL
nr:CAZy families GT49/GT8 protein [uncultured bacterium]